MNQPENQREQALKRIQKNIQDSGYHVYRILPDATPGYFYTIGLTQTMGTEVVLAGGAFFEPELLVQLFQDLVKSFSTSGNADIDLGSRGEFSLHEMDDSWCKLLLAGAFDYYATDVIRACQVMPEQQKMTLDIPEMTKEYDAETAGGWKWLTEPWPYPVDANSKVVTNVDALLGYPITEVCRWEPDQWEMFSGAGPDVEPSDIRIVPLGMLIGEDDTLEAALDLKIEEGLWRDDRDSEWNAWT